MDFTLPTSKTEMYKTLNEIFYHYRLQRVIFDDVQMQPLQLDRINFIELSENELNERAGELVKSKQSKEIREITDEYNKQLAQYNEQLVKADEQKDLLIQSINLEFEQSKEEVLDKANELGVTDSSLVLQQITQIEQARLEKIAKVEEDTTEQAGQIQAKIDATTQLINNIELKLKKEFDEQVKEKYYEIKEAQEKNARDVKKYNTSLDEKEQRYANMILETNASLKIKFLQICSEGLSKDQLIEMGYYQDVIDCVCAYYDTLAPAEAFREISNEPKLAIYLEDFYNHVIYMYQLRIPT